MMNRTKHNKTTLDNQKKVPKQSICFTYVPSSSNKKTYAQTVQTLSKSWQLIVQVKEILSKVPSDVE